MSDQKEKREFDLKPFINICINILGFWLLYTMAMYYLIPFENRGTYGDMYGGLNAVFSGLAFAGVIYTVLLQRKDLALQAVELKETRKEFIITRLTNIVYREKEKVESIIQAIKLDFSTVLSTYDTSVTGENAIDLLNEYLQPPLDRLNNKEPKATYPTLTKKLLQHKNTLEKCYSDLCISIQFVKLNINTNQEIKDVSNNEDRRILIGYYNSSLYNLIPTSISLIRYLEKYEDVEMEYLVLHTDIKVLVDTYKQLQK